MDLRRRERSVSFQRFRFSMIGVATFAIPPTFLGIANNDPGAPLCIAGIPYDLGTSNRPGSRFGPSGIRRASRMLVDGEHPLHWVNPASAAVADIGDFTIALVDIAKSLANIERQAGQIAHLVALGGDHGITLPLLRALAKRRGAPALIHLDAHVDTWPENFGQTYAHGSVFYHAIMEQLVQPHCMVQVGVRSPVERAVHDWTHDQGVVMITAQDVHEQGPIAVADRIRQVIGDEPVYFSCDIDVLDPAFAPGTGTPEIGGLASWQVQAIMRRLRGLQFIGMDMVEVCPPYDVAEITALAAATMAWEYLSLLGGSKGL
jgi:agmatinase